MPLSHALMMNSNRSPTVMVPKAIFSNVWCVRSTYADLGILSNARRDEIHFGADLHGVPEIAGRVPNQVRA